MRVKWCNKCSQHKTVDKFAKRGKGYQSWCKACTAVHNKLFRANNPKYVKRKAELQNKRRMNLQEKVWDYLREHPCIDCGEKDIVVLEFDHLENKEFVISDAMRKGFAWTRIKKEIDKCEVRCANCHRRKTARENNWRIAK